jgi:hypothetical protein
MNKKILIYLSLSFLLMAANSCDSLKESFAELNTSPSAISNADIRFLFTRFLGQSNTADSDVYNEWFYDNDKFFHVWTQVLSGTQTQFVRESESFIVNVQNLRVNSYMNCFTHARRIWHVIDNEMPEEQKATFQCLRAATYPIIIYKALKVTDVLGSMAYTEAGLGQYTNPMLLAVEYDTQEELFEVWDGELKAAFAVLNNPPPSQLQLDAQDWVYGGDWKNWAKFANTMRLKIAARWYLQNPAKAIAIVEEVYNSGVYMSESADDYVHFQGASSCHWGGNFRWWAYGNEKFINFLRDNRDPRLRWFFEKNRFSTSVIRQFLAEKKPLPPVMQPYIKVSADGKDFEWINDGEPWGRYHGIPTTIGSTLPQTTQDSILTTAQFQLEVTDNITFWPWSRASTHFFQPRHTSSSGFTTYPDITIADSVGTLPTPITTPNNYHFRGRFVMAAESYYIFAEFKVLGANISENANALFHKAIRASVTSHNMTASNHNVAWYRTNGADPRSVTVELKAGEIDALLTKPAYNLTGNPLLDLEKIYVNMMIHYSQTPTDIFVTSRRGGVPKIDSQIGFPYTPFHPTNATFKAPRRLDINEPTDDNINAANIRKAAADQGFDTNIPAERAKLHTQRVWYDKPAPDWGEGPIIK